MQQASPFNLMVNPSGNTESPMASPSCPMPGSSHQVPEQPQQQQIQGFEAAMIAQQYFAMYGYMVAMQAAFPALAMTPLQSAAFDAVGKHHIKSPGFPYSKSQIAALNERFDQSDSIRVAERREMSKRIGLTERQIKVWFQNRRFKLKKIKKARSEVQMGQEAHQHHDDTVDSGEENVE